MRALLTFVFVAVFGTVFCSFDQQYSVLKYMNPKYVKDVKVLTMRTRRNGPYATNCTLTTLVPFENNVTFSLEYKVFGVDFVWKVKFCEIIHHKWIYDYMKSVSNLYQDGGCPFKQGKYTFRDVIFPPKNFPLPLPKADTTLTLKTILTATEDVIFDITTKIIVK